jgi:hypothetical protein
LCADGEPSKGVKLIPSPKLAALAADAWDRHCEGFIYVHLQCGAHGSLTQIYPPCSKEMFRQIEMLFFLHILKIIGSSFFINRKTLLALYFIQ